MRNFIKSLALFIMASNAATAIETSTGFNLPVDMWFSESEYLGYLEKNPSFGNRCHLGVDYGPALDYIVKAVSYGEVVAAGDTISSYGGIGPSRPGGAIIIKHKTDEGTDFYALYGHIHDRRVKKGDIVFSGQQIGKVADFFSGKNSLPHLHFGINTSGVLYTGYTADTACSDLHNFTSPETYLMTNRPIPTPILSMSSSIFLTKQYDVYGIENTSIYGISELSGDFEKSAIIVRLSKSRSKISSNSILSSSKKYIGLNSKTQAAPYIHGKNKYSAGDYLFATYFNNLGAKPTIINKLLEI